MLINGTVKFLSSLQRNYQELTVYRGVGYSKNKTKIDKSDFLSNVERNMKNPMVPADYDNISSYSCSCYLEIEKMRICAKFPRKNRAVAIVMPYIRSEVSLLTAQPGVDPVVLSPFNIAEMMSK